MKFDITKFINKFLEEGKERLNSIEDLLIKLEANPSDIEILKTLKRDVHTLKGSAKMLNFEKMNLVAHKLEDMFEIIINGGIQIRGNFFEVLFQVLDKMKFILNEVEVNKSDAGANIEDVLQKIENILNNKIEEEDKKVLNIPLQETIEAPTNKKFTFKKSELFKQLGLKKEEKEVKENIPEEIPKNIEENSIKENVQITDQKDIIKEEVKKQIDDEEDKTEKDTHNTINDIVKSKKEEKILSQSIKVDVEVIDKLTNLSIESISQFLNFELFVQNIKSLNNLFAQSLDDIEDFNVKEEFTNLLNSYVHLFNEFRKKYDSYYNLLGELNDVVMETKLVPLSNVFNTFPRYIRDLSKELGKKVNLKIEGEATKLDKNILMCINDALIHIIRNSIDHGIEMPDKRIKRGKNEAGTIFLKAYPQGNKVILEIEDDGNGIDIEKVKKKALEKKLVLPDKVNSLTKEEILEFIFLSGFSTSDIISDISGRGVGMDVVRKNISKYNGEINVETEFKKFTKFKITLPVSMSTSKILFIEISDKKFGLPLELLDKVIQVNSNQIIMQNQKLSLIYNDKIYEVIDVANLLGLSKELSYNKDYFFITTKITKNLIGILVDKIIYEKENIIKGLGKFLGKTMFISGGTILENGEIVLVLDIFDIINYKGKQAKIQKKIDSAQKKQAHILLVDDSLMTREIEATILESYGYKVTTAVNGVNGFEKLLANPDIKLVVTDIEMPEMDGFELTKNIRESKQFSNIPVIIVTSLSKPEDKLKGLQVGANAYMVKNSFDKNTLIDTIKQLIGE